MKPLALEECRRFGDFLAIAIDELEGTGKGLALTLLDSPRDVSIDEGVCVDIVESESTRVVYGESRLPSTSPGGYVLSSEGIGEVLLEDTTSSHRFLQRSNASLSLRDDAIGVACFHRQRSGH